MAYDWRGNSAWTSRTPAERMALMAMMERDGSDTDSGLNVLHANWNRARHKGWDTDKLLTYRGDGQTYGWYQPLYEQSQLARVGQLSTHPDFKRYVQEVEALQRGEAQDRVGGATHYLSHPQTMLALEAKEPGKYKIWRGWSGFDPATQQYRNQTISDRSHSFLAPEGLAGAQADPKKSAQISALMSNDVDVGPADYKAAGAIMPGAGATQMEQPALGKIGDQYSPQATSGVDPRLLAQTAAREQQIKALLGMVNPNVNHPLQAIANAVSMGAAGHMMRQNEKVGADKQMALIDLLGRKPDGSVDPLMAGAVASNHVPWEQAFKQRTDAAEREKMLIAVTDRINNNKDLTPEQKRTQIAGLTSLDAAGLKQLNQNFVNATYDPKETAAAAKIKRTTESLVANGMPKDEAARFAQAISDNQIVMSQDGSTLLNKQTMEVYDSRTGRKITMPGGTGAPNAAGGGGPTGGPATPGAAPTGGLNPTKEQINAAQQRAVQLKQQLRSLDEVHNSFSPDALMAPGQAKRAVDSLYGWFTGSEVFDTAPKQERFRAATTQFFNQYRKAITGAAAAEKELVALEDATINLKLTPPQFQARLAAIRETARKELGAEIDTLGQGITSDEVTRPAPGVADTRQVLGLPKTKAELKVGSIYRLQSGEIREWNGTHLMPISEGK